MFNLSALPHTRANHFYAKGFASWFIDEYSKLTKNEFVYHADEWNYRLGERHAEQFEQWAYTNPPAGD